MMGCLPLRNLEGEMESLQDALSCKESFAKVFHLFFLFVSATSAGANYRIAQSSSFIRVARENVPSLGSIRDNEVKFSL